MSDTQPRLDQWYQGKPVPTEWSFAYYPREKREQNIRDLARSVYRKTESGHFILVAVFEHDIDAELAVAEHNRALDSRAMVQELNAKLEEFNSRWSDPQV